MIFISISLIYALLGIFGYYKIWRKKLFVKPVDFPTGVSVVVALRNEEKNISRLLYSLLNQKASFEIELIFVDDNSTDSSFQLLQRIAEDQKNIKLLKSKGEGKKSAIEYGVKTARFSIVCQTDADCKMSSYWLLSTVNRLILGQRDVVLGPVYPFKNRGIVNRFIRLEWLILQFLTVLTARMKSPGMANGANLAFYKKDYLAFCSSRLGENYASGDDMFFLRYAIQNNKKIGFNLEKEAIVETEMPNTLSSFMKQRIRWATKAGKTTNGITYFFTLILVMANFTWIVAFLNLYQSSNSLMLYGAIVASKFFTDYLICSQMAKFYQDTKILWSLPLLFFVYPIYIVLGFFLSFRRTYSWKDRVLR